MTVDPPIVGEQVGAVPMNLQDLAAGQIPKQDRGPEVFVRIRKSACEYCLCVPAKLGSTRGPRTCKKAPIVIDENAPAVGRNPGRPRPSREKVHATGPFEGDCVGRFGLTLHGARQNLGDVI
jgi:hypothetical protein